MTHGLGLPLVCEEGTGRPSPWSERSDVERLESLDRFVGVSDQLKNVRALISGCFRRPCFGEDGKLILLHGPSGSGKTTVADLVLEEVEDSLQGTVSVGETARDDDEGVDADLGVDDLPIDLGPEGRLPRTAGIVVEGPEGRIRPIVKVFVEPRTRSIRLLRDIVRAMGVNPKPRSTYGDLVEILLAQMPDQRLRMIMLDEVHHMVAGQGADVIKMLLVQLKVAVVGIGLPHATAIIEDNKDLVRHVRSICPMTAFEADLDKAGQWRGFLGSLSDAMPFDERPEFDEVGTALRLHVACEGLVGRLRALVEIATELAIDDGLPTIDRATLARAYRQIHDVGRLATPFDMEACSEEAFAPIRGEIAKRRRVGSAATTGGRTRPRTSPDFHKGKRS